MATFKLKSTGEVFGEEKKEKTFKVKSTGEIVTGKYEPKIPTLPNKSGQSNNTPSVKVPGGSLPNALDAAKQVIAKQTPVKQMGIGFNKPTPIPENPFKKAPQTLPYNPAAVKKATDKGFVNGVIARSKTPEELRQYNLQNIKREGEDSARSFAYGAERLGAGALGAVEDVGQFIGTAAPLAYSKITGMFGDNASSKSFKKAADYMAGIETISDKWKRNIEKRYSPTQAVKVVGDINETVGRMLPSLAMGAAGATGATGIGAAAQTAQAQTTAQTAMGLGAAGAGMKEATADGASVDKAVLYGATTGLLETTIESIAGSLPGLPKGKVTEIVEAAFKDNQLMSTLTDLVSEGGEEALSTFITPYIQRAIYDPNAKNATGEEIWNSAAMGMVSAGIMQAGGGNINLSWNSQVDTNVDVDSEAQKSYLQQIDDVMTGKSPIKKDIVVGDTPDILQQYGAAPNVISMKQSNVRKIAYPEGYMGGKHNLGFYALEQLPAQLADPVAILKSSTQDNSLVIFTEFLDAQNDPVMVPLHLDKKGNLGISNEIASMYGKGNYENFIAAQRAAGNVLYEKTNRALQQLPTFGLQLPKADAYTDPISKTRIAQQEETVNPNVEQAEIYTQPALPYNPNAPRPLPQNPAQGKFGEPMGIVANPEAVARAQERREFFQPKPNPEGSRNIEGSVLDNLGQGQAAFATLDNLLAQSKADAAKKPGAKEGVANVLTQRPKKFAKDNLEEQIDKIARKVVDSGRTIDTIGKAVDDKVLYPLYNNAKQSRQAAEYMIGEAQTDINGNRVGESLVSIFDPIKAQGEDYFRDFSTYLYHLHNVDRMSLETNGAQVYQDAIMQLEAENPMLQNATREEVEALASGNSDYREAAIEWLQLDDSLNDLHNKPVFGESVTAEVSRKAAAELARKNPEFAELAEKVYAYNRNLMKYRVDAGLVSQKQADIMNTLYPHYVPTFRDTSSTTGMKISGNQAKVARTVRSATGSNLDLLRIDDSMAEQTMQTVRAAKQNLLGARLLEDALKHQDKVGRHVRSVIDRYNSYDMDEPPQLGNDITIYVGGKPVSMQADDGVMEAFQSIQPRKGERIAGLEAVAKANNTFKRLVTGANPTFLLKNFARDLQDAGLYSGSLIDFAKNYPKAWQEMATGGELWQLYKSQGGTGSSYFDYEKGLKTEGKKNIVDRVEELNMMVEQAPRFAEFVSVLEKEGRTYAGIQKAMLAAADVTVNFGRGGSATQFLNRTFVPFLNPAVQGADKLVRRFSETKGAKEWVGLVGRLALMGVVPALLNELLYDDDEEYQMLNDRDKENNYVFPIGDGVWVKIPKGRALSVFGSAAQRTARFLKGDKDAFNGFIQQAYDQVGVPNPLTNNIFSQVLNADLLDPESPGKTWYGSDIEPQRLQGLPPAERYDEKTDELSKWLGKQLNISPKKINYLLDNYSGVIGDFLLPLSTPQAERNPFASAFTIDSVTSNKLSEEFYTKLDELEQAKNSKTPTAGAAAAYRYMNGVSSEVSANNKKIREIQNDKALNDKEKLEQVRKVRNTNNKLLKDAVDNLPGYMETASKSGVVSGKALDKVYLQTNYKQFGAEYALKKYDSAVYEKAKLANTRGISYEDYYKYKFSVDANGDGSVNQEEAKKQLDSMNLPSYQKAFLWEQQNKSWKKNPYK